jgi:flagellar assembly protein FliH
MASSDRASSSDRVIAADRAIGAQRWTIGGFDGAMPIKQPEAKRIVADHLPTVDEVTAIEQQAREEGYRAGLAEAREGNQRIASLLTGISESVAKMEREMAQSLVKLAIDLARPVVRESFVARPELLVPVINDALAGIARTADPGGVYVNPADLAIVEERLGDALAHGGWKPFADERIERGGCRLEFTGGQVDATVATRWTRVMAQLERHDAWLE